VGTSWVEWPRGTSDLGLGDIKKGEESEFLSVRLSLGDYVVDWVQHTPLDPPLELERDEFAIARYLDPKAFFDWIRSILAGEHLSDGGGEWNASPRKGAGGHGLDGRDLSWTPTLEEALRAWSRHPDSIVSVDRKVSSYLARMAEASLADLSDGEKSQLAEFRKTWDVIREVLVRQPEVPA